MHFAVGCWTAALLVGVVNAAEEVKTRLGNHTIDRTVQLRTHSLFAPYIDSDLQNRWWDFGADAYVNTNKYVRLTRAVPSQMGWLWSRLPLSATNYVIEIEFKIGGDSSHLYGDGMAIWLTRTRAEPGPVFGSRDKFEGLGLFLDTFANGNHDGSFPRLIAMKGDGKTEYDQAGDGKLNQIGACSANFRRTNVATKIRITYLKDKFLDVKLQHKAWDEWTDCFIISPISLPPAPYLGISAMTGEVVDTHDVISVTTYSAILSAEDSLPNRMGTSKGDYFRSPSASSGSWFGFLFKLSLLGGVAYGLFLAYKHYLVGSGRGGDFRRGGGVGGFRLGSGARGFGSIFQDGKRF